MKINTEDYTKLVTIFAENESLIKEHYSDVKESGKYKILEARVSFDVCRYLMPKFMNEQYEKGLTDKHIQTALIKALKTVL